MKKLLFNSFIILLPFALLFGFLEYKLTFINNSYKSKKASIQKYGDQVETLILGNSQNLYGINPNFLKSKSLNLANASQTLSYDFEIFKTYIEKLPKVKKIILPISYFSLNMELENAVESWRSNYYYKFLGVDARVDKKVELSNYSLTSLYSPVKSFKYAFNINSIDNLKSEFFLENGFQPKDTTDKIGKFTDSSSKVVLGIHTKQMTEISKKRISKEIIDFVDFCNSRNIEIYFITTPVWNTYYKILDPQILKSNINFIDSVCFNYKNCTYNNFSNNQRFAINDFYDDDHLNKYGAEKFTKILDSVISIKKTNAL